MQQNLILHVVSITKSNFGEINKTMKYNLDNQVIKNVFYFSGFDLRENWNSRLKC